MNNADEALLEEREIVSAVASIDHVWFVTLSCGHQSIWAIEPAVKTVVCAQCVNELVDRHRAAKGGE